MENKTGKNIAETTGFSLSTVEKVLRGQSRQYHISRETEKTIHAAAEKLGYRKNELAAAIRTGVNRTVGVVFHASDVSRCSSLHEVLSGIISEAAARDYAIHTFMDDDMGRVIDTLISRRTGTLISLSLEPARRCLTAKLCKENGIALVFAYEEACSGFPAVHTDNFEGMRLAVKYLLDNGHTRIVLCCTKHTYCYDAARHAGYLKALSDAGIPILKQYILCRDIVDYDALVEEFMRLPEAERPTAFVSTSDTDVLHLVNVLPEHGIKVPRDVSLFGFGNIRATEFSQVPLSSVEESHTLLGKTVLRVALGCETEIRDDGKGNYLIPPRLVLRQSVFNRKTNLPAGARETMWNVCHSGKKGGNRQKC